MPKWSFLMTTLAVLSHNTRTKSLNAMMLNKKGALLAILLLMVALIPEALHAQTGILRGKITDAEMGDELIGATVMLKGTTTGAAADLDGNYSITGIPAGTYDIICQFISYEPKTITGVVIKSDEVTVINVGLSTVSMGLQEVVVSAKAEKSRRQRCRRSLETGNRSKCGRRKIRVCERVKRQIQQNYPQRSRHSRSRPQQKYRTNGHFSHQPHREHGGL